ncbi:MAG: pilus (MSHA type) biogenesis protein MshL [Gammaproteobacteria bacterium]|nr:pilus (MSHA type) biogenesis protein MshL [Gammaproteobacteria bacterium]
MNFRLIVVSVFLLSGGCATTPPAESDTQRAIHSALEAAVVTAPATATTTAPPGAVRDALLPAPQPIPGSDSAPARFDVDVTHTPARAFFMSLVEDTKHNIVVHPEVSGKISLTMKNTTIAEVLNAVREVYGFDFRRNKGGWIVMPASVRTQIFQVDYLNLQRGGVSRTRVSSGQLSQTSDNESGVAGTGTGSGSSDNSRQLAGTRIDTTSDTDFWLELQQTLTAIVGPGNDSRVVVNAHSGVIVVRAMPAELRAVDAYLRTVQATAQRQVVLEAKIIEVELNDAFQSGINWVAVADTADGDNYFFGHRAPDQPFDTALESLGGSAVNVSPGVRTTGLDGTTLGGAFALALDVGDFNAFIDLLEVQGDTRVLSSPRVATLNNQKAVIKAGTDEFFVTDVSSNTVTGTAAATSRDVELTPFFSGIALDVTPQISADGHITLHIHPTVSEVVDQRKDLTISGETDRLPLAFSQIRESDSIVRARSGQVVVIGGLMRSLSREESFGAPGLNRLPGIGSLFRNKRQVERKTELVILLRPVVVEDDASWAQTASESFDRITQY